MSYKRDQFKILEDHHAIEHLTVCTVHPFMGSVDDALKVQTNHYKRSSKTYDMLLIILTSSATTSHSHL